MTPKPIIFPAPMILALLAGTKHQTRRVLKADVPPAPSMDIHPANIARHPVPYLDSYNGERKTPENPRGASDRWCWWTRDDRQCLPTFKVPYVVGDHIWVRESVCGPIHEYDDEDQPVGEPEYYYRASGYPFRSYVDDNGVHQESPPWKSPIFMPRSLSRLTLAVTAVRVQRLQDISEADAVAEGIYRVTSGEANGCWTYNGAGDFFECWNARNAYKKLWNTIHGPAAWDENPWICALTFETHRCNIDAMANPICEAI